MVNTQLLGCGIVVYKRFSGAFYDKSKQILFHKQIFADKAPE